MGLFDRRKPTRTIGNPARETRVNALRRQGSLTASGERVRPRDADAIQRVVVQAWKARSFGYYDALGEIKYASQFYSRMLSPLRLYAAEVNDDGEIVETTNQQAIDALARIQDPGGGRTGLLGAYGRLMFLVGEAYLFVSLDEDTGLEQWEMLSSDELRVQGSTYLRYRAPSLGAEEYRNSTEPSEEEGAWVPVDDREAVAYRLWQRHPRYSYLADSTMQGVLDLCEELLLLTQAVRARARSRLAGSGILMVDESITVEAAAAVPDEDVDEDPVMLALIEAMTAPMVDEGSASSVVPLVLRSKAPDQGKIADLIYHLQIVDPTQLYPETGLRSECISRIAVGLDMPREVLEGLGEANHWSAWQIDEQTWKGHGQPKAQQLCDDLTSSYFRPYLRDVEKVADWQRYAVAYDASAIINHPDRAKDAKDLYDRVALSKEALRDATGFTEDDAPSEQERAERIGILTRDSSLAWFGTPSPRGGAVETGPGDIVDSSDPMGSGGPPSGATSGSEVEAGPPAGGEQPAVGETVLGSATSVQRILGGADLGLLRAREVAGARIWQVAKRKPEVLALIEGVRKPLIAATLGREAVRDLRLSEVELVSGAHDLIVDAIRMYGVNEAVAQGVADAVEQYAVRTLYAKNPPSLPAAFTAFVTDLLRRSDEEGGAGSAGVREPRRPLPTGPGAAT